MPPLGSRNHIVRKARPHGQATCSPADCQHQPPGMLVREPSDNSSFKSPQLMLNGAKSRKKTNTPAEPCSNYRFLTKINVIELSHSVGVVCYIAVNAWNKLLFYLFYRWENQGLDWLSHASNSLQWAQSGLERSWRSVCPYPLFHTHSPSSKLKESLNNPQFLETTNPNSPFSRPSSQEFNVFLPLPWFVIIIYFLASFKYNFLKDGHIKINTYAGELVNHCGLSCWVET